MKKIVYTLFVLLSLQLFAQGPGQPFNPTTAPGSKGISTYGHILHWKNPICVKYNKIYLSTDSVLIANLDPVSIIFNGYPSSTISELSLNAFGNLIVYKKYYWRVVEYDSTGSTIGPIWYFKTNFDPTGCVLFEDDFENPSNEWLITNDGGTCVWEVVPRFHNNYWLPITSVGNLFSADADDCGSGSTTLTSAKINLDIEMESLSFMIDWDNDWNAINFGDSALVEASTNFGISWQILSAYNFHDVRNTHESILGNLNVDNTLTIRFRSVQPGWSFWWAVDNVKIELIGPMYIHLPPSLLKVSVVDSVIGVNLSWNSGWTFIEPIIGYRLFRKSGLPTSNNLYGLVAQTNATTFSYFDESVEPGEIYTYKIRTIISTGSASIPGNEATAYVPNIIPVELTSFTSFVNNNTVTLTWQTATEANNKGFQIERRKTIDERREEWKNIGFVNGNGTTTEPQSYSFVDENLSAGNYQYRLKQIDFDGTFEYSNTIEVEINSPTKFSLEQNYPNPFNPRTIIRYNVPNVISTEGRNLFVYLKVYDVLGKEIAILVNEEKSAGSHDIEFNASYLSSGIYYYQLSTGEYSETKKMVLMR